MDAGLTLCTVHVGGSGSLASSTGVSRSASSFLGVFTRLDTGHSVIGHARTSECGLNLLQERSVKCAEA